MQINKTNSSINFGSLKSQKRISELMMKVYQDAYPYKFHSNTQVELLAEKARQKGNFSLASRLQSVSDKYDKEITKTRNAYSDWTYNQKSYFQRLSQAMSDLKAGNCSEQADLLMDVFLKNNHEVHKVGFTIADAKTNEFCYDHCFLVKGAKKDAEWFDPTTWGNEAVIADPWSNIVLGAKEGIEYFKKLFGFNPRHQKMIFNLEDTF